MSVSAVKKKISLSEFLSHFPSGPSMAHHSYHLSLVVFSLQLAVPLPGTFINYEITLDAFELWCWRRLLRVPWTARRSNQSILKETSPGCSLEGLMLKLKLQYFGHLMQRADSLEKTLMLGGIGGQEEKGTTEDKMAGWHHRLDGHESE